MKNKKGFTLVELLAVIVVLGVILTVATTSVLKTINNSKEKAKYLAAKDIVGISEAYFAAKGGNSVIVEDLYSLDYLEDDATNPETGENDLSVNGKSQIICRDDNYSASNQEDYKVTNNGYEFDGYWYGIDGICKE